MLKRREFQQPRLLAQSDALSAVSGLAWALLAYIIGHRAFDHQVWGGMIAAPLIGISIGRFSAGLHNKPRWAQIAGSLFFLYVGVSCFAVGMALFHLAFLTHAEPPSAMLVSYVLATLWGLTFSGYTLVLWPLAFLNLRLVWRRRET